MRRPLSQHVMKYCSLRRVEEGALFIHKDKCAELMFGWLRFSSITCYFKDGVK